MADPPPPHVTIAGELRGHYVVVDAHDDGTLVLKPESAWRASLHWRRLRPATDQQVKALLSTHGPLRPPVTACEPRPPKDEC